MTALLGPVVADLQGTELSSEEREWLLHPLLGGLIFFSRNYNSVNQLIDLVGAVRALRPELVLMVDQEGGRVQRFKSGFTRLPPLQKIGQQLSVSPDRALSLARRHGWLMASEVLSVGIDLSLAPVLDCDFNCSDVIGDRAFSACAEQVISLAEAYIEGMRLAGMAATGKHFPGHGLVVPDSHLTLPESDMSLEAVRDSHMRVFTALADKLNGIMPAHIVFSAVDSRPVGFSTRWLQSILREQLSFRGVIFSDDLSMAGAGWAGGYPERAEAALTAGCDLVLVCNQPAGARQVLEHLLRQGYQGNSRLHELKHKFEGPAFGPDSLKSTDMWRECVHHLREIC